MVLVTVEYIEGREDEFVFIMNQLLKKLNVVWVRKVVTSQAVNVCHELLLAFGHGTLWAFAVGTEFLSDSGQLET